MYDDSISKRQFLRSAVCAGSMLFLGNPLEHTLWAQEDRPLINQRLAREKVLGLLMGSAIGDALGGPIEFQSAEDVSEMVAHCRGWDDDRQLIEIDLDRFAESLQLHSYKTFRPLPEAYGQWQSNAEAGTVTDDTRHKLILIDALRLAVKSGELPVSHRDLAKAYLEFPQQKAIVSRPRYKQLCDESLREYWKSARWVLGSRDTNIAAPPDRIWAGIPTCCGQMTLPPLAAIYPGQPTEAYRASYALSFFDTGAAKDINSALVAGLSIALLQSPPTNSSDRRQVWSAVIETMKATDPYRYSEIPFVERPTTKWLSFAEQAVRRAERRPKVLYEILEQQGQVKYYWESHFILALVFSAIEFCDFDPLAAMALILDFGHDTDSGAQLLGAFAGAIYGPDLFSRELQQPVISRLDADYDVDLDQWADLLQRLADREKYPQVISLD